MGSKESVSSAQDLPSPGGELGGAGGTVV